MGEHLMQQSNRWTTAGAGSDDLIGYFNEFGGDIFHGFRFRSGFLGSGLRGRAYAGTGNQITSRDRKQLKPLARSDDGLHTSFVTVRIRADGDCRASDGVWKVPRLG